MSVYPSMPTGESFQRGSEITIENLGSCKDGHGAVRPTYPRHSYSRNAMVKLFFPRIQEKALKQSRRSGQGGGHIALNDRSHR